MSWDSSGGRWSQQIFGELGKFRRGIIARMFDDAFADFEGEIQAVEIEIALLELLQRYTAREDCG